jgi:tetratricopeptide (TPR) repeat protein
MSRVMGRTCLLFVQAVLMLGCGARSTQSTSAGPAPPSPIAPPSARDEVEVHGGATKPTQPIVVVGRQRPGDKVEDTAEAGLLRFIAEHPTAPEAADARLRLGSLYIDQAETAADGVDPDGAPALARKAVAQLDAVRTGWPTYARRDVVLYQLGYAAALAGESAQARAAYQELTGVVRSPLVAEAWLRVGELAFDDGDLKVAVDAYTHARKDARFGPIATYKLGWSHWRQGDMAAAATVFEAALELAATNPDAAMFATEARQYLAMALIEEDQDGDGVADPDGVSRVMVYLGDGTAGERRATAETAADALLDQARIADAITIYDRLLVTVSVAADLTRLSGKLAAARARQQP